MVLCANTLLKKLVLEPILPIALPAPFTMAVAAPEVFTVIAPVTVVMPLLPYKVIKPVGTPPTLVPITRFPLEVALRRVTSPLLTDARKSEFTPTASPLSLRTPNVPVMV